MKSQLDALNKEFDDATEGVIDTNTTKPEFLTPQRTLEILVKSTKAHLTRQYEMSQEAINKDELHETFKYRKYWELAFVK